MNGKSSGLIIGHPRYYFNELDSTNDTALELAALDSTKEGTSVVADYQLQGRGQIGRTWVGEKYKNIYTSTIIYPKNLPAYRAHLLNCMVGLSIVDTIKFNGINNACIKWPNDIYVEDKKIAGILIQNIIKGEYITTSVIGMGMNVNQKIFPAQLELANSLVNILKKELDLTHVINVLYTCLSNRYQQLTANKNTNLIEEFNSVIKKNNVHCKIRNKTVSATILGLSIDGKILCQVGQEIIKINSDQIVSK